MELAVVGQTSINPEHIDVLYFKVPKDSCCLCLITSVLTNNPSIPYLGTFILLKRCYIYATFTIVSGHIFYLPDYSPRGVATVFSHVTIRPIQIL